MCRRGVVVAEHNVQGYQLEVFAHSLLLCADDLGDP